MTWSDEKYLRMLVKRHSLRQIAATYGVGLSTVRHYVDKYGIPLPGRSAPNWDVHDFAQAVKDNITVAGTLRDIGEPATSANYRKAHRLVEELGLWVGHWKGKAHGTSRK